MKYTKNKSAGFTLIELLVVIAIIGILASVVLASLNSARAKGADAAVKGGMANMAAQIELWYDNHGNTYGPTSGGAGTCAAGSETGAFSDPVVKAGIANITKNSASGGGSGTSAVKCSTSADGQSWAISTSLKGGGSWCIDNNGWRNAGDANLGVCSPAAGGTTSNPVP
jgi:prepilin-type N-terminal cleavage/methylation domain-containing protein